MAGLMEAVAVLKELNRLGGRKVPGHAPAGFVPARYAGYLEQARKTGGDTSYRHYWELEVPGVAGRAAQFAADDSFLLRCRQDGPAVGDGLTPREGQDPSQC
jgi:hypothetical protein